MLNGLAGWQKKILQLWGMNGLNLYFCITIPPHLNRDTLRERQRVRTLDQPYQSYLNKCFFSLAWGCWVTHWRTEKGIYGEEVVIGVNTSRKHTGIRRLCAMAGPHLGWDHHLEWWRASFPALTPRYHSHVEESVAEARMACGASWLWTAWVDYGQSIRGTSKNLNVKLHLQVHSLL